MSEHQRKFVGTLSDGQRSLMKTLLRAGFAVVVAYLFIIALMTASAQQQVIAQLADRKAEYTAAQINAARARTLEQDQAAIVRQLNGLVARKVSGDEMLGDLTDSYNQAWVHDAELVHRILVESKCAAPATEPAVQWAVALQCSSNPGVDKDLAAQIQSEAKTANIESAYARMESQKRKNTALVSNIAATQIWLADNRLELTPLTQDESAFDEMNLLSKSWMPGGALLIQVPPSMIQILLAFAAGMFGAMLLVLVLTVYPKVAFDFATSDTLFSRVLLGGLVSVCVYVVLGGGSAVLGNTTPFNSGQSNFLTFSAWRACSPTGWPSGFPSGPRRSSNPLRPGAAPNTSSPPLGAAPNPRPSRPRRSRKSATLPLDSAPQGGLSLKGERGRDVPDIIDPRQAGATTPQRAAGLPHRKPWIAPFFELSNLDETEAGPLGGPDAFSSVS